ncbi:hypothetical protein FHR83_006775 [Actinoplanes campanulatus]|uniref:Uncharacterized protein n=1 Tax=Actinoplanes campanulatus TaxID=113559 RepID=A0A7W5FHX0_9ACTN|nr:hypothetical protein [Actinoplanes campanulatus]MBB3099069.1 hypothetical protein [Actinoplanes campanulatus]GGN39175.1 hypothetical protein GCM10010109_66830 [Actinoplanes campanulatus]GID40226.1 hypothetical protein Aca09nite_67320 [Actinoplanes campanulatus]
MPHSEQATAVLTANEPKDGTVLLVRSGDEWKVIERDDALSRDYDPQDHWFDVTTEAIGDSDPMALHQHVKYADAVYALGEKLAEFR